jgi:hypothetical protein
MHAGHKAAISIFKGVNEEMLPARIEQGVAAPSFSKDDLYLIAPSDVAAWDDILTGRDAYCAALDEFASGKSSAELTAASESLGIKIQSLIRAAKGSGASSVGNARTAVSELGGILVKYKASREARAIARAADPSFQIVIGSLIDALGFAGHPPAPVPHGLLATCEVNFRTMNAEKRDRRFRGDAIAGFDAMTPAERRLAIKDFVAWLGVEQDHEALIESVTALAVTLDKTAAAHAAFAQEAPGVGDAAFADLRAEIQNTVRIFQQLKKG